MLVKGTYSQEKSITCGVPEAPILGLLLFDIFINNLPPCLSPKFVKCDISADHGTLETANDNIDDIRRDLQQSLSDVSDRYCTNLMTLNPTKTIRILMATDKNTRNKSCL